MTQTPQRKNKQPPATVTTSDKTATPPVANRQQVVHVESSYEGPLPPPSILAQYDEIVPGSAARLIDRMEKQSDHRMELERTVINGDSRRATAGLIAGFIVTMVIIAASVYLIIHGFRYEGCALFSINLVALVTVFVHGSNSRRQERQHKMDEVTRREKRPER